VSHVDDAGFSALDHVRHLPVWLKRMNGDSHISVLKLCTVQENSCRLMAMTCDKDRLRFQRLTSLHLSLIPKFSTPLSVSGVNIWSPMTAMLVKDAAVSLRGFSWIAAWLLHGCSKCYSVEMQMKHSCGISCDLCVLCSFSSDVVSGMTELILMLF
jgi:hypothetical protein